MKKRSIKNSKPRFNKVSYYGVIVMLIMVAISLVRNITRVMNADREIAEVQQQVDELREKNIELKNTVDMVNTDYYVEREARNKLGMSKEGDTVLVLPEDEILRRLVPLPEQKEETLPYPNWKKWMELFI